MNDLKDTGSGSDISSDSSWTVLEDRNVNLIKEIDQNDSETSSSSSSPEPNNANGQVQDFTVLDSTCEATDEEFQQDEETLIEYGCLTWEEYLKEQELARDYGYESNTPSYQELPKEALKQNRGKRKKCKAESLGLLTIVGTVMAVAGISFLCILTPKNKTLTSNEIKSLKEKSINPDVFKYSNMTDYPTFKVSNKNDGRTLEVKDQQGLIRQCLGSKVGCPKKFTKLLKNNKGLRNMGTIDVTDAKCEDSKVAAPTTRQYYVKSFEEHNKELRKVQNKGLSSKHDLQSRKSVGNQFPKQLTTTSRIKAKTSKALNAASKNQTLQTIEVQHSVPENQKTDNTQIPNKDDFASWLPTRSSTCNILQDMILLQIVNKILSNQLRKIEKLEKLSKSKKSLKQAKENASMTSLSNFPITPPKLKVKTSKPLKITPECQNKEKDDTSYICCERMKRSQKLLSASLSKPHQHTSSDVVEMKAGSSKTQEDEVIRRNSKLKHEKGKPISPDVANLIKEFRLSREVRSDRSLNIRKDERMETSNAPICRRKLKAGGFKMQGFIQKSSTDSSLCTCHLQSWNSTNNTHIPYMHDGSRDCCSLKPERHSSYTNQATQNSSVYSMDRKRYYNRLESYWTKREEYLTERINFMKEVSVSVQEIMKNLKDGEDSKKSSKSSLLAVIDKTVEVFEDDSGVNNLKQLVSDRKIEANSTPKLTEENEQNDPQSRKVEQITESREQLKNCVPKVEKDSPDSENSAPKPKRKTGLQTLDIDLRSSRLMKSSPGNSKLENEQIYEILFGKHGRQIRKRDLILWYYSRIPKKKINKEHIRHQKSIKGRKDFLLKL